MIGASKPARLSGGDDIMDVLYGVIFKAEAVVNMAAGEQIEAQQSRLQEQAQQQWQAPPETIKSWEDEEGNAAFGVPDDDEFAQRASEAEYGTPDQPPTAMLRMGVLSQVSDIGWSLSERFRSEGL